MELSELTHSASIVIARSPEDLYEMVSDVTRMGEWSPVCKTCWWDESTPGPAAGAWFTGRNEAPGMDPWETRSQVVAANPGKEFAFAVGGGTRWGYTFTPVADGTSVTESWEVTPTTVARFEQRFGDNAAAKLAERAEDARTGIPATLAALKRAAEA